MNSLCKFCYNFSDKTLIFSSSYSFSFLIADELVILFYNNLRLYIRCYTAATFRVLQVMPFEAC